jgi:hypothetical protein
LVPTVAYSLLTLIIVAAGGFILWYRGYYNIWPGQELFAAIYPGAQPSSCATVVYVRVGPDKYQSYGG